MKSVDEFGRVRLSDNFFMREFLYSDIAIMNGFRNLPDDPNLAIEAGTQLCTQLLESLQKKFGRVSIRSAYRSCEVNDFGNKNKLNCASNEANYAHHIWDRRDKDGHIGATACIFLPEFWDNHNNEVDWQKLAWWVHDHLPYNTMYFFPKYWAFNLNWNEKPERRIDSYAAPKGCLTKEGMENHSGDHSDIWKGL